jgi:hypothetical protein
MRTAPEPGESVHERPATGLRIVTLHPPGNTR